MWEQYGANLFRYLWSKYIPNLFPVLLLTPTNHPNDSRRAVISIKDGYTILEEAVYAKFQT